MNLYAVEGAGLISLTTRKNGDAFVHYTGTGLVHQVAEAACEGDVCVWSLKHQHWNVPSHSVDKVRLRLEKSACSIPDKNVRLICSSNKQLTLVR